MGESIKIGENIEIIIFRTCRNQVRIGIKAPKNIAVHRDEVYQRIKTQLSHNGLCVAQE